MSRHQSLIVTMALATLAHGACRRAGDRETSAGTVTLVNRVTGDVRCLQNSNCEATLDTALRRRIGSVAIKVRPERKAVELEFEHTASAFSSASFRQAVADGGGDVVKIVIEACGRVDNADGQAWLTTGSTRLLLDGPGPFDTGADVCVTGELRDQSRPPRLVRR